MAEKELPQDLTPASKSKVTWGPIAAVLLTITIFFVGQYAGAIIFVWILQLLKALGLASLSGQDIFKLLDNGPTWIQFGYLTVVELCTLGLVLLTLKLYKSSVKAIGLFAKPKLKDLGYAIVGYGVYFAILIVVVLVVRNTTSINTTQEQIVGFDSAAGAGLLLTFIGLVILVPFTEEILTRGFLYEGLRKKLALGPAAIATSLMFGAAHLQFGSDQPLLWIAAIDTFTLSMVMIFIKQKREGSLWPTIFLHMIKNSIAFVVLFSHRL